MEKLKKDIYAIINLIDNDNIFLGIPNENAIRGHMKVGWQEQPNIPYFSKIKFKSNKKIKNEFIKVKRLNPQDNDKLKQFSEKYDFSILKNNEFINWRYTDRPYTTYEIYKLKTNGSFLGYIILKYYVERESVAGATNKLHIVDYGYNSTKDFLKILKFIETKANDLKVDILDFWCYNKEEQKILLKEGFNKDIKSSRLITYSNADLSYGSKDNWKIVLGDNDVY